MDSTRINHDCTFNYVYNNMDNKIFLVTIKKYGPEENCIINICSNIEKAEELKSQYTKNSVENNLDFQYEVIELDINFDKEILWDCYKDISWM